MQSPEKTPKRVWPSDKSIPNPFAQSTTEQGEGFSEHRPLKVQSGIAAGQPIRLLGLCTEQSILLPSPQMLEVADPNLSTPGAGMNVSGLYPWT